MLSTVVTLLSFSAISVAEKAIIAQAGPLYPSFGEGYGITKYVEALKGLFWTNPDMKNNIALKVFDKGTLYTTQEAHVEAVAIGAIQMSYCAPHMLEAYAPEFKVATIPGLFENYAHFERAMDMPAWKSVHENLAKEKGITVIKWLYDAGELYLFSTTAVNRMDDLYGRKIRHPGGEGWRLALAELGANPISISYTEVVTSLQTNLISGLITDFAGGADYFELNKFTPHTVIVPVTIQPICFIANTAWWQSLGEKRQKAIKETFEILDVSRFYADLTAGKITEWDNNPKLTVVRPKNVSQWHEQMRRGAGELLKDVAPALVEAIGRSR